MNTEEKQLMSRAKALLMNHYGLTEPDAHRFLMKTAMDTQAKAVVIAERIIELEVASSDAPLPRDCPRCNSFIMSTEKVCGHCGYGRE